MEIHMKVRRQKFKVDSFLVDIELKDYVGSGLRQPRSCRNLRIPEELDHIIFSCKGLSDTRKRLVNFTNNYVADKPIIQPITEAYHCETKDLFCQFVVDCSVLPLVISSYQLYGPSIHEHLYYITRT